ncbi:MAG: helix-turn-helix domain-containing protein [Pseudonocardiaceae bacterium]
MSEPAAAPRDSSPAATLLKHLGRELRRRRIQADLSSQAALAKKISYTRAYIAQVELAREVPAARFVHACDEALHTGGALMELYRRYHNARSQDRTPEPPPPPPPPTADDLWNPATAPPPADTLEPLIGAEQNRRTFLRNATILAGTTAAAGATIAARGDEPWQRLTAALRGTTHVDTTTVINLERVTVGLERLEAHMSPTALVGAVIGHLDAIARLLRVPMRIPLRQHLCSVAAETSALAGWLTWDLDTTPATAAAYFRAGLDAADDAGDRAIGAYLVGGLCIQPSYREQPGNRLRNLDGSTLGYAQADASPATRSWMACLEAEAHVMAGDERAALTALDRAESILEHASGDDPIQRRPRISFFDHARLLGERGVAMARLGRAEPAQAILTDAMSSLDPTMTKIRPRLLAELASSAIQRGDIDTACRHASDALVMAADLQVQPNLQDVYRIRRDLNLWADTTPVRDLDRRLADLTGGA